MTQKIIQIEEVETEETNHCGNYKCSSTTEDANFPIKKTKVTQGLKVNTVCIYFLIKTQVLTKYKFRSMPIRCDETTNKKTFVSCVQCIKMM